VTVRTMGRRTRRAKLYTAVGVTALLVALIAAALVLVPTVGSLFSMPTPPAHIAWLNDTGRSLYIHPCTQDRCAESDEDTMWVPAPHTGVPAEETWEWAFQVRRYAVATREDGEGPLKCIAPPARQASSGSAPAIRLSTAVPCT